MTFLLCKSSFPWDLYDFSSPQWEMMEVSNFFDGQRVGWTAQPGPAEPYTLKWNPTVLKDTGNPSFFPPVEFATHQVLWQQQAVRHHVRYCRRIRS
jgi:hypothetical protein